jgi:hypothetical protein
LILAISLSKLKEDEVFSTSLVTVSFLASNIFFWGSSFYFPFSTVPFAAESFPVESFAVESFLG